MKIHERILWIAFIILLLVFFSVFVIFVKDARAGNTGDALPFYEKLYYVYNTIKSDYVEDKIDSEKLMNGAIKGMLEALEDEHSIYLTDEYMKDMRTTSSGKYGGVGLIISQKDNYIQVISVIEDSPSFKKGVKSGDYIISVNGESIKGFDVNKTADMLRGKPGTIVKIEVLRNDIKLDVEIKRELISLPTVKYDFIKDKYGYLRITQFAGTTDKFVKEALENFSKKSVKGLIIDLRNNPGGLLEQVIQIVDFFQANGVIVSTKGKKYYSESKANSLDDIVNKNIPIIILIDKGSASASEIFAGALKDTKRAILLGEKSYGKGSVQSVFPMNDDGFKLTIAKYYTPSNKVIDKIGIEPDLEVKEPELNEVEKDALKKIYNEKIIEKFIKSNPNPSDKDIDNFIAVLHKDGYKLSDRNIKRLIKNGLDITDTKRSVYDLEYDIQLQKAVELLDKGMVKHDKEGFYLQK